jgi:hypothetical protein
MVMTLDGLAKLLEETGELQQIIGKNQVIQYALKLFLKPHSEAV